MIATCPSKSIIVLAPLQSVVEQTLGFTQESVHERPELHGRRRAGGAHEPRAGPGAATHVRGAARERTRDARGGGRLRRHLTRRGRADPA